MGAGGKYDGTGASWTDPHAQVSDADRQYIEEVRSEAATTALQSMAPFAGLAQLAQTASGHFAMSPEQIEAQLSQCKQILYDLGTDQAAAIRARQIVQPPAADTAGSVMQANAFKDSLGALRDQIQTDIQTLTQWQDMLNKAKQDYMEQEHVTADQWTRLALGLEA